MQIRTFSTKKYSHQRHHAHALHVAGGAPRVQLGGGVATRGRGGGQGGGGGRGGDGGPVVVHASQVEALQADAGHAVLNLLSPQLRRLLLLLDQPADEGGWIGIVIGCFKFTGTPRIRVILRRTP